MNALHTLSFDDRRPTERVRTPRRFRRLASVVRTHANTVSRRWRLVTLVTAIALVWAVVVSVAVVWANAAPWVALAVSLGGLVIVTGPSRGLAPALLAAIPVIGVVLGMVIATTASDGVDWHSIIAMTTGATALMVAVAALSDAIAGDHASADRAWRLADERERLSDEFVSFIAHEIRTPMTTLAGTAGILRRRLDALSATQRTDALADIENEVMRLSDLADELMSVTRRSAGQSPQLAPAPVAAIVEDTVRRHRKLFGTRRIEVTIDDPRAVVEASPLLTSHVIANLLVNAEKYSPSGEPIEVRTTTGRAVVEIEVRDHGAGIAPADQTRIFSLFYRSPSAPAAADGHGIGLALSQRLMEAQGGHLWVEPRESGAGSVFHIVIPAGCEH